MIDVATVTRALAVIATTDHIRAYLVEHDPQALAQADRALAGAYAELGPIEDRAAAPLRPLAQEVARQFRLRLLEQLIQRLATENLALRERLRDADIDLQLPPDAHPSNRFIDKDTDDEGPY